LTSFPQPFFHVIAVERNVVGARDGPFFLIRWMTAQVRFGQIKDPPAIALAEKPRLSRKKFRSASGSDE